MENKLTYKAAGVDIDAGNRFVDMIKPAVKSTFRPEVMTDIGGFGGLFGLNAGKYKEPVLVSGTDGVGTKLKVAFMADRHDTVGIDLVAMCVNDVIVTGAEPLFFLDYFATGRLDPERHAKVVEGIAEGCRQAGCALIGGETAEMPGFYTADEYDLAGFVVGVVDKGSIIDGKTIKPGDAVVGMMSTGLHSNGYSLARKVFFDRMGLTPGDNVPELGGTVAEVLLTPTRIYVKTILGILESVKVKGLAHITGGGITENLPRVLPEGCTAVIDKKAWTPLPVFRFIMEKGNIDEAEMFRDFNMGLGMMAVVDRADAEKFIELAEKSGEKAFVVGEIVSGERGVEYIG
ncbi:MAG: phosphoribosylformylglycinamidine cyclo-ligase [Nitrospirae bacterium]|nr:phosphoribosylformylglycinamidine cyclo-ligase [Nitrospirota bacterium]MBI5694832.1 phosphoribosylformylglycinamidine cyclo-ligase [Nitrospirota bacterium]